MLIFLFSGTGNGDWFEGADFNHLSHLKVSHCAVLWCTCFLYVLTPEAHILLQSRKLFFSNRSVTFFLNVLDPPGLRKCNRNFVCLSVYLLSIRPVCQSLTLSDQNLLPAERSQFKCYLYEIWYTSVSMWCLETLKKDFGNFWFFFSVFIQILDFEKLSYLHWFALRSVSALNFSIESSQFFCKLVWKKNLVSSEKR